MTIPDFQTLMRQILLYVADRQQNRLGPSQMPCLLPDVIRRAPASGHHSAQWFEAAVDVVGQARLRTVLTDGFRDYAYSR